MDLTTAFEPDYIIKVETLSKVTGQGIKPLLDFIEKVLVDNGYRFLRNTDNNTLFVKRRG